MVKKYVRVSNYSVVEAVKSLGKMKFSREDWTKILRRYLDYVEGKGFEDYVPVTVVVNVDDGLWNEFVEVAEKKFGPGPCGVRRALESALLAVKYWNGDDHD